MQQDGPEVLAGELARAQRAIETQAALASKAGDEAVQRKQASESATAELRQSLQKEHDRAEALTGELARARRNKETEEALSNKAGDEAGEAKQVKIGRAAGEEKGEKAEGDG